MKRTIKWLCLQLLLRLTAEIVADIIDVKWQKECPKEIVTFYYYSTRSSTLDSEGFQIIISDTRSMNNVPLTASGPIKFLIHGLGGSRISSDILLLKQAYFKSRISRDIIVMQYTGGFSNVATFAKCGAELINKLKVVKPKGVDNSVERIHIIGFSLGAHIAAQISNNLQRKYNIMLERITGLDPALPIYFPRLYYPSNKRLSRRHATFVDVIHTNIGGYGTYNSNAHIDAYANNGKYQPGCGNGDANCSHTRAIDYFAETITQEGPQFRAKKCEGSVLSILRIFGTCKFTGKIIEVGERCEKPINIKDEGKYVFETNSKPPFIPQNTKP